MEEKIKIGDIVCEIGKPNPKMTVIAINEEKQEADCTWTKDRKSKDKEQKTFPLNKLVLAKKYSIQKF